MAIEAIKCPECGGEKSTSLGSNKYSCEYCGAIFTHITDSGAVQSASSICPYCGGEIKFGAQKCPHCGEWLNKEPSPTQEIISPFPPEIFYDVTYHKSFGCNIVGEIFITPDKLIFKAAQGFANSMSSSSLSDRIFLIKDIKEIKKGMMTGLTIFLNSGKKLKFDLNMLNMGKNRR